MPDETIILQCPRCRKVRVWVKRSGPPGSCECGAWAPWRVWKPPAKEERGFVRVISSKGWQELQAPHYQEDPNGWK